MSERPRFAELFAGAGGLSMGLERAGWACAWHAEIADAPRAVLESRWPQTPLYGDVLTLDGAALVAAHGPIDLLTGGSPCQDLSVAGKRAGMAEGSGTRSSLFYEQMRLWDETGADLCLWENVDGARSSSNGRDFGAVLRAFVGAAVLVPRDGWRSAGVAAGPTGVAAWRVLDAQFFGVPQRRRRVFVLGTRTGRVDPAEVLSLAEGVRGDSAPRGETGEGVAADAGECLAFALRGRDEGSLAEVSGDVTSAIRGASGGSSRDMVVAFGHQNSARQGDSVSVSVSPSLDKSKTPAVLAFNTKQDGADADDIAPTPLAMPHDESHANGGGQVGVVFQDSEFGCKGYDTAGALRAGRDPHHQILLGTVTAIEQACGEYKIGDVASALNARDYKSATDLVVGTLDAREHGGGFPGSDGAMSGHVQAPSGIPRRLTPRECERLQAWPDDHTLVQFRGKPMSDSARYKMCGNGVASVHSHWIGWRLRLALELA